MSLHHSVEFPLSCTAEAAAFIAAQIGSRDAGEGGALRHSRLAVLGLQNEPGHRRAASCRTALQRGFDDLLLCAQLLRSGAQLVVLDRPRNRMLIEVLLPLAQERNHRLAGSIELERDLSSACRAADGVLLLPGWRSERLLAWGVLADRLRPGAQVFDLRPDGHSPRALSSGLRIWHLGSFAAVF
ncbi:MAG: hypothetical protein ACKOXO_00900 [Cyanobium sp.]